MEYFFVGGPQHGERLIQEFSPHTRVLTVAKPAPPFLLTFEDEKTTTSFEQQLSVDTFRYRVEKTSDPNKGLLIYEKLRVSDLFERVWDSLDSMYPESITE